MAKKVIRRKNKTKSTQVPQKSLEARVDLAVSTLNAKPTDIAPFKPGDTVKVHCRIKEGEKERIQIYEGVVIARYNRGAGKSFTVRKMSHGVGVERIFLESSPKIAKLEVAQVGKVRRSKLYYIRELEGKAARVERQVETQTSIAQREAAKSTAKTK